MSRTQESTPLSIFQLLGQQIQKDLSGLFPNRQLSPIATLQQPLTPQQLDQDDEIKNRVKRKNLQRFMEGVVTLEVMGGRESAHYNPQAALQLINNTSREQLLKQLGLNPADLKQVKDAIRYSVKSAERASLMTAINGVGGLEPFATALLSGEIDPGALANLGLDNITHARMDRIAFHPQMLEKYRAERLSILKQMQSETSQPEEAEN